MYGSLRDAGKCSSVSVRSGRRERDFAASLPRETARSRGRGAGNRLAGDGRAPQRRDARLSNAGRRRATSTATGRASGVTRPRRGTLRYERRNSQRGLVSRQLRFETAPMGIRSRGEADVAGDSTPWATSLFRSSRSFQTAPPRSHRPSHPLARTRDLRPSRGRLLAALSSRSACPPTRPRSVT